MSITRRKPKKNELMGPSRWTLNHVSGLLQQITTDKLNVHFYRHGKTQGFT